MSETAQALAFEPVYSDDERKTIMNAVAALDTLLNASVIRKIGIEFDVRVARISLRDEAVRTRKTCPPGM